MATIGDTLPHCTGTGTQTNPYIFEDEEGFLEAIDVIDAYVEAKTANMQFDCNDSVIAPPFTFKCSSFKGKGLTIINAVLQNQETYIINYAVGNSTDEHIINGLNLFNFCIISDNNAIGVVKAYGGYDSYSNIPQHKFNNCNFAGVVIGGNNYFGLFSVQSYPSSSCNYYLLYKNCSFNVHLEKIGSNNTENFFLGNHNNSNYDYHMLNNCVIGVSGETNHFDLEGQQPHRIFATNCTFLNSASNPLNVDTIDIPITYDASFSGYNYHKMYVNGSSGSYGTLSDTLGLWNTSRYHITNPSYTGIQMQETDSSLSTYIYNEQNLSNAGFLVGRVIE